MAINLSPPNLTTLIHLKAFTMKFLHIQVNTYQSELVQDYQLMIQ